MALITDLPASTSVASADVFIKDTGSTTQKITAPNLFNGLVGTTSISANSGTVDSSKASGSINCYKWGKVLWVALNISLASSIAYGGNVTVGTLPSGFRPNANRYINYPAPNGVQGYLQINATGEVIVSSQESGKTVSGWVRNIYCFPLG